MINKLFLIFYFCSTDILVFYKKSIGKVDWVVVKELAGIAEQVKNSENIELVK